jgi:hypothetical protein
MKILWLSPSDMILEFVEGSLESLDHQHEVRVHRYDKHGSPPDRAMLQAADEFKPEVILYVSQAAGPWLASPSTFKRLSDRYKTVHLCLDAFDIGFAPLLEIYAREHAFTLTVACDGGNAGPVDYVSFHPVDPRPYAYPGKRHVERSFALGTCGGFPYGLRKEVCDRLVANCGMVVKPREEKWGSYGRYARFLGECRIVLDCALSAGGFDGKGPYARTLKTRAIEVGLAGACLLELRGAAIENHFDDLTPPFLRYEDGDDAERWVRNLQKYPETTQVLADAYAAKIRSHLSPRVFFDELGRRLGCAF